MDNNTPSMLTDEEGQKVRAAFAVRRHLAKKEEAERKVKSLLVQKNKVDPAVAAAVVQQMIANQNQLPKAEVTEMPEATTTAVSPKLVAKAEERRHVVGFEPIGPMNEPEPAPEPVPEPVPEPGPITNEPITNEPITNEPITNEPITNELEPTD